MENNRTDWEGDYKNSDMHSNASYTHKNPQQNNETNTKKKKKKAYNEIQCKSLINPVVDDTASGTPASESHFIAPFMRAPANLLLISSSKQ